MGDVPALGFVRPRVHSTVWGALICTFSSGHQAPVTRALAAFAPLPRPPAWLPASVTGKVVSSYLVGASLTLGAFLDPIYAFHALAPGFWPHTAHCSLAEIFLSSHVGFSGHRSHCSPSTFGPEHPSSLLRLSKPCSPSHREISSPEIRGSYRTAPPLCKTKRPRQLHGALRDAGLGSVRGAPEEEQVHTRTMGRGGILFFFLDSQEKSPPDLQRPILVWLFWFFVAVIVFPKEERLTPSGSREPGGPRAHACAPCTAGQGGRAGWTARLKSWCASASLTVRKGLGQELRLPFLVCSASCEDAALMLPVGPACSKKAEPISLPDLR